MIVYPREILEYSTRDAAEEDARHQHHRNRTILQMHDRWWSIPDEMSVHEWAPVVARRADDPWPTYVPQRIPDDVYAEVDRAR